MCCKVLLLFLSALTVINADSFGVAPVITDVTPDFGSVEGGTWVTITGAHFMQTGLFSQRAIFIGGEVCEEVMYYTTDSRIICIAPPCYTQECLSSPTWNDDVVVSLDLYVTTVIGILSTQQQFSFTYSGGWTPEIFLMSRYTRGSAFGFIQGRLMNDKLSDFSLRIDNNLANVGDPGEFNDYYQGTSNMYSWYNKLYYKPPSDLTAGFYNLTLTLQDDQSSGYEATGQARTFPLQRPYSGWSEWYRYNYDATLTGTVFSVSLQPAITSINNVVGSIAGGTVLTITGAGFSNSTDSITVYAGGLPCAIVSASVDTIICRTSSSVTSSIKSKIGQNNQGLPYFTSQVNVTSSRDYGSPGWWIKLTDSSNKEISLSFKSDMLFSMYYGLSSTWYTDFNLTSVVYTAEMSTYLTAPFSGYYRFYMSTDDSGELYGTQTGTTSEQLLLSTSYTDINDIYGSLSGHISSEIFLNRGDKYKLRLVASNYAGPDYVSLGLKIRPMIGADLSKAAVGNGLQQADVNSSTFLRHHALQEVQIVSLSMLYHREIQVSIR